MSTRTELETWDIEKWFTNARPPAWDTRVVGHATKEDAERDIPSLRRTDSNGSTNRYRVVRVVTVREPQAEHPTA